MKQQKNFSSLFALNCIYFLDNFALALVFPIFASLLSNLKFGYELFGTATILRPLFLGLLISSFALAQYISMWCYTKLIRHSSRKSLFIISSIGMAIGLFACGISLHLNSYVALIISRFWTGFFAGNFILCLIPPVNVPNQMKISKFHKTLSSMGASGFIFGILIGGILSDTDILPYFTNAFPFWIGAIFSLTVLFITSYAYIHDDKLPKEEREKCCVFTPITRPPFPKKIGLIYITYCLFMISWLATIQFFSIYFIRVFGLHKIAISFTLIGMTIAYLFGYFIAFPSLRKTLTRKNLYNFSFAGAFLFSFLSIFSTNIVVFFVFHILFSLYAGMLWALHGISFSSRVSEIHFQI